MNRDDFEAGLRRDGYEVRAASREANETTDTHAHSFDARLFIIDGEITIARGGIERSFRPGEVCDVPGGEPHEERVGPTGVRYVVGRRSAQPAS